MWYAQGAGLIVTAKCDLRHTTRSADDVRSVF